MRHSIGGDTKDLERSSAEDREAVASDLLNVLHSIPIQSIATNGPSLVHKVRFVASTLLDAVRKAEEAPASAARAHAYLWDFLSILSEIERIKDIIKYLDENSFSRVCLYMVSIVPFLTYPDDKEFLETVHTIYRKYKRLPQAMDIAVRLNNMDLVYENLQAADPSEARQLAFNIARVLTPAFRTRYLS